MSLRPLARAVETWQPTPFSGGGALVPIAEGWKEIVGSRVAENSVPLALEGDALIVGTPSSAWSQQLEFLAPQIIERIEALARMTVARLRFRSGGFRRAQQRRERGKVPAPARRAETPVPEPARDLDEAFDRLRRSIAEAQRRAVRICARCGAPLEDRGPLCAPCSGGTETARRLKLERLLFNAPWLSSAEIVTAVRDTSRDEIEAVRRNLLLRWWVILERARRSRRALSNRERLVASSYILLHSGLAPDRITPAIVRNLLGDELEAQLSGTEPTK